MPPPEPPAAGTGAADDAEVAAVEVPHAASAKAPATVPIPIKMRFMTFLPVSEKLSC
jgi:hypothetical protein